MATIEVIAARSFTRIIPLRRPPKAVESSCGFSETASAMKPTSAGSGTTSSTPTSNGKPNWGAMRTARFSARAVTPRRRLEPYASSPAPTFCSRSRKWPFATLSNPALVRRASPLRCTTFSTPRVSPSPSSTIGATPSHTCLAARRVSSPGRYSRCSVYRPAQAACLPKPNATRAAADAYGFPFHYESHPNYATYDGLLAFARTVRRDVRDLRPRDMIDIQSFLWVQGSDEYPD